MQDYINPEYSKVQKPDTIVRTTQRVNLSYDFSAGGKMARGYVDFLTSPRVSDLTIEVRMNSIRIHPGEDNLNHKDFEAKHRRDTLIAAREAIDALLKQYPE